MADDVMLFVVQIAIEVDTGTSKHTRACAHQMLALWGLERIVKKEYNFTVVLLQNPLIEHFN